jgi:hypothetical protein
MAAAGMSAWTLGEYALGLHTTRIEFGRYTGWGTELIFIFILWRLLRETLHQPNRSWLPVWEGLLHGAVLSLVAAMGYYVFVSFYLHFINPDCINLMLESQIAHWRAAGKAEAEIRQMARGFLWSVGPMGLPVTVFGLYLLIGLVASPLLTLWLNWRRKEEPIHAG